MIFEANVNWIIPSFLLYTNMFAKYLLYYNHNFSITANTSYQIHHLFVCLLWPLSVSIFKRLFLCINSCFNCCYMCVATDTSSASEDEGSLRRRQAAISAMLAQNLQSPEYWINRSVQGSSTSSSASSTLSHGDGKTHNHSQGQTSMLADVLAHTRIGTAR